MKAFIRAVLLLSAIHIGDSIAFAQSCVGNQEFKNINISTENVISFTVEKDCPKATYEIKEFRWNKWTSLGIIKGKGSGTNSYEFTFDNVCDLYKIRIELKGIRRCRSAPFENPNAPLSTEYSQGTADITFSISTRYEIFSAEGIRLLAGCSDKVNVSELVRGTYSLNYGQLMGKFVKK